MFTFPITCPYSEDTPCLQILFVELIRQLADCEDVFSNRAKTGHLLAILPRYTETDAYIKLCEMVARSNALSVKGVLRTEGSAAERQFKLFIQAIGRHEAIYNVKQ